MDDIASSTLAALREQGIGRLPYYDEYLMDACQASPPLFGEERYGEIFREAAQDPQWLAISLITNAEREGDGATRLWNLAACTSDAAVSDQIRQHAIDESGHARAYVAMLDIAFPSAVDRPLYAELLTLSPGYNHQTELRSSPGSAFAHAVTLDDLIQMNIAEIRTRIHHLLQRPMLLKFCPDANKAKLIRILDSLLYDETRHIAYTACLIDDLAAEGDAAAVKALMLERLRDFDQVTSQELESRVFD
jgi:hypothetical protein